MTTKHIRVKIIHCFESEKVNNMTEEIQEKDQFILYIALVAAVFVGVLLMVKSSESDKFAPIKEQINEENRLMNIRVLN